MATDAFPGRPLNDTATELPRRPAGDNGRKATGGRRGRAQSRGQTTAQGREGKSRRLGLRMRMTLAFALGALALSLTLSALTYQRARTHLVRQRETAVLRQSIGNFRAVHNSITQPDDSLPDVPPLAAVKLPSREAFALLWTKERQWSSLQFASPDDLPAQLRQDVLGGAQGETRRYQRVRRGGELHLAVGLSVGPDAAYFEMVPLGELSGTLMVLRNSLAVASLVTALGGAALGRWASRRVLQPVAAVAGAARAVADGRLDVRLEVGNDPDLATVATAFNQMTNALQERIQRDARFASAVSHELRSPLTTLATSLEVLRARRQELPERARAALDLLASEVQRFQRLVQDLLEISRIDAGAEAVGWEKVRLGEFVLRALQGTGQRGFFVDFQPEAAQAVVRADKRRLERVVANLVENAEHYGGGVVRVALRRSDGALQLAVEDAGPGVPVEERERIFERFARGQAAGRRGSGEGTGLGLSLVAEHVKLHGGRVWVEDRRTGGARFVVELPLGR